MACATGRRRNCKAVIPVAQLDGSLQEIINTCTEALGAHIGEGLRKAAHIVRLHQQQQATKEAWAPRTCRTLAFPACCLSSTPRRRCQLHAWTAACRDFSPERASRRTRQARHTSASRRSPPSHSKRAGLLLTATAHHSRLLALAKQSPTGVVPPSMDARLAAACRPAALIPSRSLQSQPRQTICGV